METAAKLHSKFERRTAAVDELVISRFPQIAGISLLAAGGYGRREMFPHSDVDLILLADSPDELPREPISRFLQDLWDAGLRVSQSVHSVSECLSVDSENLELTISLLDQRFLAGDAGPHRQLAPRLEDFFRRRQQDILRKLVQLTRARHQRFQNTIYHLEPNMKDGPGGLRDYQALRWFSRLRGDDSAAELAGPAARLNGLRWLLHELSGRDNNVLDFESQEQLASDEDIPAGDLMSGFYRAARKIQRAAIRLLDAEEAQDTALFTRLREHWSRESNSDFAVSRGLVFFRSTTHQDLPRLFEFVARNGLRLAPDTGRSIHAGLSSAAPFHWTELREILCQPHAALALREMHETGLLTTVFPELAAIECLVIRDFYHQYTVDEHTLVAIANVVALRDEEGSPFAELAREHSDLSILLMALLFHDAGKGSDTESHSEASARLASGALTRIGMPASEIETVLFLIRAHLYMSATMNSRDLSEPATLHATAERAGTVENLKLLTLLTYADISAVNPSAMSPWRSSLLWQLYSAAHRELMRELQSERLHVNSVFLEGLPVRYLRTHSDADIQLHIRMAEAGTAIDVRQKSGIYQLTAVTVDRPALFASIAGAISSFGMNILKAEAFSNASGTVIDTFMFADPLRTLELNPSEVESLKHTALHAALGEADIPHLLKKRPMPRYSSSYEPRIAFDNDASETSTLLQIIAADRPGLLYDVASVLSAGGCNIEVVLVDTQGRRAIDVFYITPKLSPDAFPEWNQRLSGLF